MTTIEKLDIVLQICANVIEVTSVNDTRMEALNAIRDGVDDVISDLYGEE